MAKVRQNLVGNSIGIVSGERGNSLAETIAEAGNTIIVIYSRNQNIGEAAGQKNNLQAMRVQSPPRLTACRRIPQLSYLDYRLVGFSMLLFNAFASAPALV